MNFRQNSFLVNSAELLKYSLFQLPISIITGETALLVAKLGVIETTSQVKKLFSTPTTQHVSSNSHKHEENSGVLDFYYSHLKESLIGGIVYYGAATFVSSAKAISAFKSYESIFGHSHPKLSGYFKSAYIIYDNAHTTAHILDLLQTSIEAIFSQSSTDDLRNDAFEHFNNAYEFTYDYFTTIANLLVRDEPEISKPSHDEL